MPEQPVPAAAYLAPATVFPAPATEPPITGLWTAPTADSEIAVTMVERAGWLDAEMAGSKLVWFSKTARGKGMPFVVVNEPPGEAGWAAMSIARIHGAEFVDLAVGND